MNKHMQDKHSIPLSLLISLFLHLIFTIYIVTNNNKNNTPKSEHNPLEPLSHSDDTIEWVEINAKSAHSLALSNPQQEHSSDNHDDQPNGPEIEKTIDTQASTIQQHHRTPTTHSVPLQSKSTHKSLPSLSQLTQGMMNYMQNGTHRVSMLGKKSGTPTDEQLKYERYLERLNQCLHNSFVINSFKQPRCNPPESSLTVYLALNQDGSIHKLALVKSCGNNQIDTFVMYILREASSSFPPVPHYLPHNPFVIHYVIGLKPLYQ